MDQRIKDISDEEIENFRNEGAAVIYVNSEKLYYLKGGNEKPYALNHKKDNGDFYYVLTEGLSLIFPTNPKDFSRPVKVRNIHWEYDLNEDIHHLRKSYSFTTDIYSPIVKRFKTTFIGVPTEVLIIDEEKLKADMSENM